MTYASALRWFPWDQLQAPQRPLVEDLKVLWAETQMPTTGEHLSARRSSYGTLRHLAPAPSAEDIDQVRQEIWESFGADEPA